MRSIIQTYLDENNPKAIKFDGLDAAIVGVGNQYTKSPLLIYSARAIVECYMKQGMTYDEAVDFYGHNCECLWAGEHTPIIIIDDLSPEMPGVSTIEDDPPTTQIRKQQHALAPRSHIRRDRPKAGKNIPRVPRSVRASDSKPRATRYRKHDQRRP